MSGDGGSGTVVPGGDYVVVAVDDEMPDLARMTAKPVVTLALGSNDDGMVIRGCARADGDVVELIEQHEAGLGSEVRTWEIRARDGRVEAAVRSKQ